MMSDEDLARLAQGDLCAPNRCRDTSDPSACLCAKAASEIARLSEEARALREALAKAHEAAEISECRIAEVYDYIVKARDAVNGSAHLASGVVPRGSLSVLQDIFEWLQKAKYGLGGRTNVAGSIAELTRAALARAKGEAE